MYMIYYIFLKVKDFTSDGNLANLVQLPIILSRRFNYEKETLQVLYVTIFVSKLSIKVKNRSCISKCSNISKRQ